MTRGEAVNWLINIMADIGKAEHSELWHYEQALSEIREILESEPERKTEKMVKILADVLDGSPLTQPCDCLWEPEGWCKEHCKAGQGEPDAECWLKYAEVKADE